MKDIITQYIVPKRIVLENNVENSDVLLSEHPRQAILGDFVKVATIQKGGYIVLDFGEELQGGANITVKHGSKLRIVFGESVSEAMSTIGVKNATNNHAIRDFVYELTSWQNFETHCTGFRFLKLEAVEDDVVLFGVQAASKYRDYEYKGSFCCNDEEINQIWKVGARTVHLNMQEYIWDGIKRDRLVWIGDMHPETSTILSVFGGLQLIKKSLDMIRDNTPSTEWMHGIPSYNMWWIRIHYDFYNETGDYAYLQEQTNYICDILENTIKQINDEGIPIGIERKFVEWSSNDTPEMDAGCQAMLIHGLLYGGKICRILGIEDLAIKCDQTIAKLYKQNYTYNGNKQISAMVSLMDMAPSDKISNDILKVDGAKGMSTFWGYYVLLALAKTGDYLSAIKLIKDYWGLMIKFGATSFWEDFDVEWTTNAGPISEPVKPGMDDLHGDFGKYCYMNFRHSLCHGWASGPTAYLSKIVLGIVPLEPGYSKIKIEPHLDGLTWVKGSYPTPYGNIDIKHSIVNGKVVTECHCPKGIEIIE